MQAVLVAAWMLSGAAIALIMVRRGHSPILWWFLIPCGPLLALLALNAKDEEGSFKPTSVREGAAGPGSLHVLVGVDGKDSALSACRQVVDELGPALGRITLAAVLNYDVGQVQDVEVNVHAAELWLDEAAQVTVGEGGPDPSAVVLVGNTVNKLAEWAKDNDVDLIVVAGRSHSSAHHAIVGGVAHGLMVEAGCPVMVVTQASQPRGTSPGG